MSTTHPHLETTDFVLIGKSGLNGKRLSFHKVENEKIGAEIPFLESVAKKIFKLFNEADKKHIPKFFEGLIPSDILFASDTEEKGIHLIWKTRKQLRKLSFDEECGIPTGVYSIPNLIFDYKNNHLSVYATSDSDININENTELYQAPFYNTYSNGSICMGNVNVKKANSFLSFNKVVTYLENVFFNSVFTHSNDKQRITKEYVLIAYNGANWNTKNLFKTNLKLNNLIQ